MKGKSFVNFIAYVAVALIAIALILGKVFSAIGVSFTVINAMNLVAQFIAYAITAVFAFAYAKERKNIGWMIAYIIFVVAIIVFLFVKF